MAKVRIPSIQGGEVRGPSTLQGLTGPAKVRAEGSATIRSLLRGSVGEKDKPPHHGEPIHPPYHRGGVGLLDWGVEVTNGKHQGRRHWPVPPQWRRNAKWGIRQEWEPSETKIYQKIGNLWRYSIF